MTSSETQQRFNDHRATCRLCFFHCISTAKAALSLCEFGRTLQGAYLEEYAREAPVTRVSTATPSADSSEGKPERKGL